MKRVTVGLSRRKLASVMTQITATSTEQGSGPFEVTIEGFENREGGKPVEITFTNDDMARDSDVILVDIEGD